MTHNLVFKRKMPQADNMAQNEKWAWREDGVRRNSSNAVMFRNLMSLGQEKAKRIIDQLFTL